MLVEWPQPSPSSGHWPEVSVISSRNLYALSVDKTRYMYILSLVQVLVLLKLLLVLVLQSVGLLLTQWSLVLAVVGGQRSV